jgi:hypothetical protein
VSTKDLEGALSSDVHEDVDKITLRDAADLGVIPWTYGAAHKRLQRDRAAAPQPCGQRDRADLYRRADLIAWVERTNATSGASS